MNRLIPLAEACQDFFDNEEDILFHEVIDKAFDVFYDPYDKLSETLQCSPEIVGQWQTRQRTPDPEAQKILVYEILDSISAEA